MYAGALAPLPPPVNNVPFGAIWPGDNYFLITSVKTKSGLERNPME